MRILTAIAIACTAIAPAFAQTPPSEEPKDRLFDLPSLVLDVDSKYPMLDDVAQKPLQPEQIAPAVMGKLKFNPDPLARMEIIRRAAQHLLAIEDAELRRTVTIDLFKEIHVFYADQQAQRRKLEEPKPKAPDEAGNQRPDADAPGGVDASKLYALTSLDVGWAIEVFVQAKLLRRDVELTDYQEGVEFVKSAIAIHPLAELSFAAAVLTQDALRTSFLNDAVSDAPALSVLDRNLVACFGQDRIERIRAAVSPLRKADKDK